MGFLDKMKAANGLNLGSVESPDFPCCIIVLKDNIPTIIGKAINSKGPEYQIFQKNIRVFKLIAGGGNWAKYLIIFKDGKSAYITQDVISEVDRRKGTSISVSSIERFIKYTDDSQMMNLYNEITPENNNKNSINDVSNDSNSDVFRDNNAQKENKDDLFAEERINKKTTQFKEEGGEGIPNKKTFNEDDLWYCSCHNLNKGTNICRFCGKPRNH